MIVILSTLLPLLVWPLFVSSSVLGLSSNFQSTLSFPDGALPAPGENPFTYCEDPKGYLLSLEYVDLNPQTPKPGDNLTVTASGTLSKDIEVNATISLLVKWLSIPLVDRQEDLCDNVGSVDLECPIEKGVITITKDVQLPNEIPKGKYNIKADALTKDKEKITCLEAEVRF